MTAMDDNPFVIGPFLGLWIGETEKGEYISKPLYSISENHVFWTWIL
jgi:hypothetical protein